MSDDERGRRILRRALDDLRQDKGHVHWGAHGGAGLVLRCLPEKGQPTYLMAQRSRWVDEGGTWGIPGGAIRQGESPEATARREAEEEIGPLPAYRVERVDVQDCGGGWRFHVVIADVDRPFPAFSLLETDVTGWFTWDQMPQPPPASRVSRVAR